MPLSKASLIKKAQRRRAWRAVGDAVGVGGEGERRGEGTGFNLKG